MTGKRARSAPRATGSPRLLVVDDDAQVRQLIVRLLGPIAAQVTEAPTAEHALEHLQAASPDLVLLDLQLPGRPGHDVLAEIRSTAALRLIPVIMMSGAATRSDRLSAIRAGVTDFLAKPFDPEELIARVTALLELKSITDNLEDAARVIVALARAVDARDPYTAGHSERVAMYAGLLADRVGLPEADALALRRGCLFHDLGKIAVRDDVLHKPGALTPAEFVEIQRHPRAGYDLLSHMQSLSASLPVVLGHHERLDGTGYPDGIAGDAIAIIVRIASIADVYDGLTTTRPYRDAFARVEAMEILTAEATRGWWDPELLEEFRGALARLPEGRSTFSSQGERQRPAA
jgi:putative two-component system response regulator